MNKIEYFTKFVALSLLISASVLIVVKAIGIPDAYQIMGAYLRVDGDSLSLLLWFSALLVLEAISLHAVFILAIACTMINRFPHGSFI